MIKPWYTWKLRTQILVLYIFVSLLIVSVMGVTLFFSTSGIIKQEAVNTTVMAIDKSASQLEMYIQKLKGLNLLFTRSPQVQRYFSGAGQENDRTDIAADIASVIAANPDVASVFLLGADGAVITNESGLDMDSLVNIERQEWYQTVMGSAMPVLTSARMQEFSMDKDTWVISMGSELLDTAGNGIGVLRIDLKYDAIEAILSDLKLGKSGYAFIVNASNEVVYHPDSAYFTDKLKKQELVKILASPEEPVEKNLLLTHSRKIPNCNWLLVGVASLDGLADMQRDMVVALWILGGLILAAAFAASSLFAGRVSNPVMAKINSLMDEVREKEKSLRISELKTLYNQINPHFIYNTLDTIVWLAEFGHTERVVAVSKAMARFFRLSLRGGSELTTVREELDHARQYLLIQKERYQDKLNYEITADESMMDLSIPKILLQPVIENAINHGIRKIPGDGLVRIRAFHGKDSLIFTVEDNGPGFTDTDAVKQESPRGLGGSSGVGLKNVAERIALYYGPEYGLSFENRPDGGARVTLKLGAVLKEKESSLR